MRLIEGVMSFHSQLVAGITIFVALSNGSSLYGYELGFTETKREIVNAAKLTGAEYENERNRLVEKHGQAKSILSGLSFPKEEWEAKLLSEIIIMRIERKKLVEDIETSEMPIALDREGATRRLAQGNILAARCREVPALLIEALWKGNAVRKKFRPVDDDAYLCSALGLLKVIAARQILEANLKHEYFEVRAAAASALGKIGSPESVPALYSMIIRNKNETVKDYKIAADVAIRQIPKCADINTIEYLRKSCKEINNDEIETITEQLIKEIETKFKTSKVDDKGSVTTHPQPIGSERYFALAIATLVIVTCVVLIWRKRTMGSKR